MSDNRYNLDWSLWGTTPKKSEKASFDPSATIGSRCGGTPKKRTEEATDDADAGAGAGGSPQKKALTCTLKNAQFLPDETTGFNHPCKITVDVEGTAVGPVRFALWATYRGIEYNLKHETTSFPKDGKAQAELKLFYVDQHYDDINHNGDANAVVEYYAKASNKAAREIKSELLKMPLQKEVFTLSIEHRYHDNEPVCEAPFEIECADGSKVNGKLDEKGNANLDNLTEAPLRILFHPDAREYTPVNLSENVEYRESFSQADADDIVYAAGNVPLQPEKKSLVLDSVQWVWGTLKGSFNEKQSVSQIVVDAVIGMVPVVGDVTAVRDIIAVTIGLSLDDEKRKDKLQWMSLVLLLFALIPVFGGVVKGVGKLLLKSGKSAAKIADFIAALNRIGVGDAVKFVKELNLEKYTADILGKFRELIQRLDTVIASAKGRFGTKIPAEWISRLDTIQNGLKKAKNSAEMMIPDAIKELQVRLKVIQDQLYKGEWHDIPKSMKSSTREIEARIVEEIVDGAPVKKWKADKMDYPPSSLDNVIPDENWPDLTSGALAINRQGNIDYWAIKAFHGPIKPVLLPPGTKIRRVLDNTDIKSKPAGNWWVYTDDFPKDGRAWREDLAVLEDWSKNGEYVEYVVGKKPGLYAWEGRVSSQFQNSIESKTQGQYLKGGGLQLLIDFNHAINSKYVEYVNVLPRKQTNWGKRHLNVNVPEKDISTVRLKAQEIAPKGNLLLPVVDKSIKTVKTTNTKESK